MNRMDDVLRRALEGNAEAEALSPRPGPIVLSSEYLRLIERVEALPQNRPGTDKTWTERALESWREELEDIRESPPA